MIEDDYTEDVLYLPVEKQHEIARIRKLGEILTEEYLDAKNGSDEEVHTVVRLHFKTAHRNRKDLEPIVNRYRDFKPDLVESESTE